MWTTREHYVSQEESSGYMQGMLRFRNFNQGSASRKMLMNKRLTDGLEAPRNSLELPTETSKSCHMFHENVPFSLQVKHLPVKQRFHHPGGITMKTLIDKEMSSNTSRLGAPSVVARLMGMDTLPSEGDPLLNSNYCGNDNPRNDLPRKNATEGTSAHYKQLGSIPFKQKKQLLFSHRLAQDANRCSKSPRLTKLHRREHPQEELLQKFKKDFEAWQAAKVWERSRAVGLDDSHLVVRNNQTSALENFGKQKKALHADPERNPSGRKLTESLTSTVATTSQRGGSHHQGSMSNDDISSFMENRNSRNRMKFNDSGDFPELKFNRKQDKSSSTTRIVILKPSTERFGDIEESWPCLSEIVEREGSMEYFLDEVRERLRFEIQGKARNDIRTGECLAEIPFSEKLTDPKQIAQHIAKQIRESVTRDLATTLMRSESTRSYRSESQPNGPSSSEFINRNTRKLLCERLRNVLQSETDIGNGTVAHTKVRPSTIIKERARLRQLSDCQELGRSSYSEDTKDATEMATLSFREEQVNNVGGSAGDQSPRNLVRSLSAPVSGTAFGKLLLEEQNALTGVHIRRKHETTEKTSVELRKIRKDVFNLKGRVSNLGHNLTLRGKLFGRKVQSADESGGKKFNAMKAIATSPSVLLNLGIAQENSTEVPPSPASVSSSSYDELCKPSHPSPVSPLEMPFTEDHPSLQISGEISSDLPAKNKVDNQSETIGIAGFEEVSMAEELHDAADMKCHEEAYLRDILLAAGLYDKSFDEIVTHSDLSTKPVAELVFEKVEKSYANCEKINNEVSPNQLVFCRRILFDLLNEELLHALSLPISSSMLKRSLLSTQVLQGKRLLDNLWEGLEIHLHPPVDESASLDSLMAYDLGTTTWSETFHGEIDMVGRDVEYMILLELIDEFVSDV